MPDLLCDSSYVILYTRAWPVTYVLGRKQEKAIHIFEDGISAAGRPRQDWEGWV
jgi:hypothetical protein